MYDKYSYIFDALRIRIKSCYRAEDFERIIELFIVIKGLKPGYNFHPLDQFDLLKIYVNEQGKIDCPSTHEPAIISVRDIDGTKVYREIYIYNNKLISGTYYYLLIGTTQNKIKYINLFRQINNKYHTCLIMGRGVACLVTENIYGRIVRRKTLTKEIIKMSDFFAMERLKKKFNII